MLPASTWRSPSRPSIGATMRGVVQVEARARDLRLAGLDGAVQLADLRFLADHLLRRDQLFLLQLLVALEVGLGVAQPGLVLFERALGLRQLHLIGPRVDLGQHLALRHALAFGEVHLDQLAVEARAHRHGVDRRHRAQRPQVDVEVLPRRRDDPDRHHLAAAAASAEAAARPVRRSPVRRLAPAAGCSRPARRCRSGRRRSRRRRGGGSRRSTTSSGISEGRLRRAFRQSYSCGGAGRTDRRTYAAGPSNCCAVRPAWPAVQPHILRRLNKFLAFYEGLTKFHASAATTPGVNPCAPHPRPAAPASQKVGTASASRVWSGALLASSQARRWERLAVATPMLVSAAP